MNLRELARILALGRILIGVLMLVVPRRFAEGWIGSAAEPEQVTVITRALGARDLALGAGTAAAMQGESGAREWLAASAFADACDFGATLAVREHLPALGVISTTIMAGGAAAICAAAAFAEE